MINGYRMPRWATASIAVLLVVGGFAAGRSDFPFGDSDDSASKVVCTADSYGPPCMPTDATGFNPADGGNPLDPCALTTCIPQDSDNGANPTNACGTMPACTPAQVTPNDSSNECYNPETGLPSTKADPYDCDITPWNPDLVVPAYPAYGSGGTVQIGTVSLNDNPGTHRWNHGLTYRCADGDGFKHFTLGIDGTAPYSGTYVEVRQSSFFGEDFTIGHQAGVVIDFSGEEWLRLHLAQVIVHTSDTRRGMHHDDQVIDLRSQAHRSRLGELTLDTSNFIPEAGTEAGPFMKTFTLCVSPRPLS